MSHIVEVRTEVRDPQAVAAACRRLGLPEPAMIVVTPITKGPRRWGEASA